jgi:hypothetical protein
MGPRADWIRVAASSPVNDEEVMLKNRQLGRENSLFLEGGCIGSDCHA